jgi:hypothetical protein
MPYNILRDRLVWNWSYNPDEPDDWRGALIVRLIRAKGGRCNQCGVAVISRCHFR